MWFESHLSFPIVTIYRSKNLHITIGKKKKSHTMFPKQIENIINL